MLFCVSWPPTHGAMVQFAAPLSLLALPSTTAVPINGTGEVKQKVIDGVGRGNRMKSDSQGATKQKGLTQVKTSGAPSAFQPQCHSPSLPDVNGSRPSRPYQWR